MIVFHLKIDEWLQGRIEAGDARGRLPRRRAFQSEASFALRSALAQSALYASRGPVFKGGGEPVVR